MDENKTIRIELINGKTYDFSKSILKKSMENTFYEIVDAMKQKEGEKTLRIELKNKAYIFNISHIAVVTLV